MYPSLANLYVPRTFLPSNMYIEHCQVIPIQRQVITVQPYQITVQSNSNYVYGVHKHNIPTKFDTSQWRIQDLTLGGGRGKSLKMLKVEVKVIFSMFWPYFY